jgi:hypothetical protein
LRDTPIIQRTQPEPRPVNARRRLNINEDGDEEDDNNIPQSKKPRNRRETENNLCTVLTIRNLMYLDELIPNNLNPGIYILHDKQTTIENLMNHLTDVFTLIKDTLHAWHYSLYYTKLHNKMNQEFVNFKNLVLNESQSTFEKKKAAIKNTIAHIKTYMREDYLWYQEPQQVPNEIQNLFQTAIRSL